MIDKIFGKIEYNFGWNGNVIMNCFGKKHNVDIIIYGEENTAIETYQYQSFTEFMKNWNDKQQEKIKIAVFNYYCDLRSELGYDDESNSDFPNIENIDDIIKMIDIDTIILPTSGIFDGRCVNLALNCTWDDENGLGIRFINEEIYEIGYQDIVF